MAAAAGTGLTLKTRRSASKHHRPSIKHTSPSPSFNSSSLQRDRRCSPACIANLVRDCLEDEDVLECFEDLNWFGCFDCLFSRLDRSTEGDLRPLIRPPVAAPVECRCQKLININVSGQRFIIASHLIDSHPATLLGNSGRRKKFFDRRRGEYFFDRHRPSFEAIFDYYRQGGKLRRPVWVPDDVFLNELIFFQLENDVIEDYKFSEGYTAEVPALPATMRFRSIWTAFENPHSSNGAYLVAVISLGMTVISIILMCVETLPQFAKSHCVEGEKPNFADPFFVIESICTIWFTIEIILRLLSCPSKLAFIRNFRNVIDVTAVLPFYITLANVLASMSCQSAKSSSSLAFLRAVRLSRIFKLTRHSTGLQVLILTVRASSEELGLFFVVLLVFMLVYSSAIYYAELDVQGSNINSIPDAFWWSIITMTTVGYGDKTPVGGLGKAIGAACAISGVLALAMPVPIITGHFNRFYAHKTGRCRYQAC